LRYVTVWTRVLAVVAVLNLLLALVMYRPLNVIIALTCASAVSAVIIAACRQDQPHVVPLDWSQIREDSALLACLLVGLPAAAQISPGATIIMILLAVGTAPPLVGRARSLAARITRWPGDASTDSATDPDVPVRAADRVSRLLELGPTPERVASLDTATLCLAWRRSFLMLSAASTPAERSVVADLRQVYLDELDKRYPSSVATWLASFPSPGSGPDGYLPRREGR
jgi:hypothetical protein